MNENDLHTKLHDQYNTIASPLQDPEAFSHDVFEIATEATTIHEFHEKMASRKEQRLQELNESLESASIEIIANPSLIGTEQWQHALQLFRTKSLDSLVRYFASYTPEGFEPSFHAPRDPSEHGVLLAVGPSGRTKRRSMEATGSLIDLEASGEDPTPHPNPRQLLSNSTKEPTNPTADGVGRSDADSRRGRGSKPQPSKQRATSQQYSEAESEVSTGSQVSDESLDQIKSDLEALQELVSGQVKTRKLKRLFRPVTKSGSLKSEYEDAVQGLLDKIKNALEQQPASNSIHEENCTCFIPVRLTFDCRTNLSLPLLSRSTPASPLASCVIR